MLLETDPITGLLGPGIVVALPVVDELQAVYDSILFVHWQN